MNIITDNPLDNIPHKTSNKYSVRFWFDDNRYSDLHIDTIQKVSDDHIVFHVSKKKVDVIPSY